MKKIILTLLGGLLAASVSFSACAQSQTLVTSTSNIYSAVINVCSNSYAVVKNVDYQDPGILLLNIQGVTFSKDFSYTTVAGLTIYGPATIQLQGNGYTSSFASIEVKPLQQPVSPNQTLAIGSNAGNVQVTLQTSTDLVNWTNAVSGIIYSNTPDAQFFRIQLLTNVQGP